jgi:hypothetical protein
VYSIVLKDIRQNRLGGLSFERPWPQFKTKI